jgi:hypothetical protein
MAILALNFRPSARAPRPRRREPGLRAFVLAAIMLVAGGTLGTLAGFTAEAPPSEYQVKAAFLINFPKYAEWPAEAFAETNSPIVIATLGETKVTAELQKLILGRTVNGREIVLKSLATGEEPGVCHILFISAAGQQHSPGLLAKLNRTGILTVGESDAFLESGWILNLARRDQKIGLEVNLDAASSSRIKISSKLLSVANVVKGKSK